MPIAWDYLSVFVNYNQELKKEREPAKTPALTNESWGRILPEYEK